MLWDEERPDWLARRRTLSASDRRDLEQLAPVGALWSIVGHDPDLTRCFVPVTTGDPIVLVHGQGAVVCLSISGDRVARVTVHEGHAAAPYLARHAFQAAPEVRGRVRSAFARRPLLSDALAQARELRPVLGGAPPGRRRFHAGRGILEVTLAGERVVQHRFLDGADALAATEAAIEARYWDVPLLASEPTAVATLDDARRHVSRVGATWRHMRMSEGRSEVLADSPMGPRRISFVVG